MARLLKEADIKPALKLATSSTKELVIAGVNGDENFPKLLSEYKWGHANSYDMALIIIACYAYCMKSDDPFLKRFGQSARSKSSNSFKLLNSLKEYDGAKVKTLIKSCLQLPLSKIIRNAKLGGEDKVETTIKNFLKYFPTFAFFLENQKHILTNLIYILSGQELKEELEQVKTNFTADKKEAAKNAANIVLMKKQLLKAITSNDLDFVQEIISDCPRLMYSQNFSTHLFVAIVRGYTPIVELLLKLGANPNVQNNQKTTPLIVAAKNNYEDIVRLLIKHGANPDTQNEQGATPLIEATRDNCVGIIHFLLSKHANPNLKDSQGQTALHLAVKNNHREITNVLVLGGANLNAQDLSGRTPLHEAVANGYKEIVELLLKHGAKTDIKDNQGKTPLDYADDAEILNLLFPMAQGNLEEAIRSNDLKIVKLIIENKPEFVNSPFPGDDGVIPLILAIVKGHKEIVELLLQSNADPNIKDDYGDTPLHDAALLGYKEIAELLLKYKADPNIKENDGVTPLHDAANKGYTAIAELLLNYKADPNIKDNNGNTPLHEAAGEGYTEIMELLLKHGAKTDIKNNQGKTPLDYAVNAEIKSLLSLLYSMGKLAEAIKSNDLKNVKLIIENKPEFVNSPFPGDDGNTPLILAAFKGHKEIAELLLKHGAKTNIKTNHGYTPLFLAAFKGHKEIVELLLQSNADPNIKENAGGTTPLHVAAAKGDKEIAELLLKYKADPNIKNNDGNTPLHGAANKGHKEIVELLLKHGAKTDIKNNQGKTPLDYAANAEIKSLLSLYSMEKLAEAIRSNDLKTVKLIIENKPEFVNSPFPGIGGGTPLILAVNMNHKEIVELLLQSKADPNIKDNIGTTPLHRAAAKGDKEIVELLLKYKADPNIKSNNGYTPLHAAANKGHKEIVELLLKHGAKTDIKNNQGKTPLDYAANAEIRNLLTSRSNNTASFQGTDFCTAFQSKLDELIKTNDGSKSGVDELMAICMSFTKNEIIASFRKSPDFCKKILARSGPLTNKTYANMVKEQSGFPIYQDTIQRMYNYLNTLTVALKDEISESERKNLSNATL